MKKTFKLLVVFFTLIFPSIIFAQVPQNDPQAVILVSPQSGTIKIGDPTTISWRGGRNSVQVALWKAGLEDGFDNGGGIAGWITMSGTPDSSVVWAGKICGLNMDAKGCFYPVPGEYKIKLVSADQHGNYITSSNSDAVFNNYLGEGTIKLERGMPNTSFSWGSLFYPALLVSLVVFPKFRKWAVTPFKKSINPPAPPTKKQKFFGWMFIFFGFITVCISIISLFLVDRGTFLDYISNTYSSAPAYARFSQGILIIMLGYYMKMQKN